MLPKNLEKSFKPAINSVHNGIAVFETKRERQKRIMRELNIQEHGKGKRKRKKGKKNKKKGGKK